MAAAVPNAEELPQVNESAGLPQFQFETWSSQIFWLILTFAVLYFVLSKFILPRICDGLTERSDRVADDLDAASRMQQEAEQAEIEFDRPLADTKAKAQNNADTNRRSVDAEIEKEVEAAEADFAAKQADADDRIRKIKTAAMAKIDAVATDTASALVEKLINTKPAAAAVKSAVSQAKG